MSKFASIHGLGITCDSCRRQVSGRQATYSDLVADHPGWTMSACPACNEASGDRTERRFERAAPSDETAGLPPHLVLGLPRPRRLR